METSRLVREMASTDRLRYDRTQFITTHILMISQWNSFRKHVSALHRGLHGIYFTT